ncbi:uncharacterized protein LAESUDRAFT_231133 [Laetiporus sulphureus 93-53]|uniref:Uncharacterized protein n=1 Tax=Laetiporus sulphureus 93-53 TaxID=1314785 RepID=A0A165DR29_9APHY|nr:uncharacterized protein LAESUDRAFT_231133 [Laetiporus sulphureus 93-53]KZT05446.1 hypothetical protein LAESUDRAFT_231133 [Laetiporus sulphureus 93-53]
MKHVERSFHRVPSGTWAKYGQDMHHPSRAITKSQCSIVNNGFQGANAGQRPENHIKARLAITSLQSPIDKYLITHKQQEFERHDYVFGECYCIYPDGGSANSVSESCCARTGGIWEGPVYCDVGSDYTSFSACCVDPSENRQNYHDSCYNLPL